MSNAVCNNSVTNLEGLCSEILAIQSGIFHSSGQTNTKHP